MSTKTLTSSLLLMVLAGCGHGAPTAGDLKMPAAAFPGLVEVTTRALAADEEVAEDGPIPPETTALRRSGLSSAAQYRYTIDGEHPGRFKVRVDVFRDEATAIERFRTRHLPQAIAMTEPLPAGDEGFIYQDLYAGFRVGPVAVEIRADGAAGRLPGFTRAYADFVAARLHRSLPSSP